MGPGSAVSYRVCPKPSMGPHLPGPPHPDPPEMVPAHQSDLRGGHPLASRRDFQATHSKQPALPDHPQAPHRTPLSFQSSPQAALNPVTLSPLSRPLEVKVDTWGLEVGAARPHSRQGPVPLLGGPFPGAPPPSTHASLGGVPSSRGTVRGPSPPPAPQGSEIAPGGGTGGHLSKKSYFPAWGSASSRSQWLLPAGQGHAPGRCGPGLLPKKGQAGGAWASCLGAGEGDTPSND